MCVYMYIYIIAKCKAFITVKDHKDNFQQNPKYRHQPGQK